MQQEDKRHFSLRCSWRRTADWIREKKAGEIWIGDVAVSKIEIDKFVFLIWVYFIKLMKRSRPLRVWHVAFVITKLAQFRLHLNLSAQAYRNQNNENRVQWEIYHKLNLLLNHHPCLAKTSIVIVSTNLHAAWIAVRFSSFWKSAHVLAQWVPLKITCI
jgi:hypothetical protein